jgi:FdhD protein
MNLPVPKNRDERENEAERQFEVVEISRGKSITRSDSVVVEEPMEIRVVFGPAERRVMRNVSITMRTPGHDEELAIGFLVTEGLLTDREQVDQVETRGVDGTGQATGNIVRVSLRPEFEFDPARLQRHFFSTSSCGVCGKASLEALAVQGLNPVENDNYFLNSELICGIPAALRDRQATFANTGGLHGTGLIDSNGQLVCTREDVGRHNAVDKLVGRYFLDRKTPLSQYAMIVSGRVSFEIMQKALVASVPMIIAVGAPSSLAIETARTYNMTLIGFASETRFNIYSSPHRTISA